MFLPVSRSTWRNRHRVQFCTAERVFTGRELWTVWYGKWGHHTKCPLNRVLYGKGVVSRTECRLGSVSYGRRPPAVRNHGAGGSRSEGTFACPGRNQDWAGGMGSESAMTPSQRCCWRPFWAKEVRSIESGAARQGEMRRSQKPKSRREGGDCRFLFVPSFRGFGNAAEPLIV